MSDRNHKLIAELLNVSGNNHCADCGQENPEYGSYNLGVFLCTMCATFHQKIGTHVSKVKSLKLAKWSDDQIQSMDSLGNNIVNKKYEKHLPFYYRKPVPDDPPILLEQWIRAKYERQEFIHVDKQKYNKGSMENYLLVKKKKDNSAFAPKLFQLSEENRNLSILKEDTKEAKVVIPLARLNICLGPPKMSMDNCMQLTFIEEGITRHIFVAHEKAESLIDWYMGIRRCKLIALKIAYPSALESELVPYLTKDFVLEGWASKTGPHENDAYRKRWITLDGRKLMYHLQPLDDSPRGEIFLGHSSENYSVRPEEDTSSAMAARGKEMTTGHVFSLVTPGRTFYFSVASAAERDQWLSVIETTIQAPLGPHDIQCRVLLDPSKKRASRHSWFHF